VPLRAPDPGAAVGAVGALALAGLLAVLWGERPAPVSSSADGRVRVVTTLLPLEMLVREVGGHRVTVSHLVPSGASPHAFAPLPRDLARVARADLLVVAGGGLDDWTERLLSAGADAPIVLSLHRAASSGPGDASEDPHLWLDPILVRDALAPALAEALGGLDPEGLATYAAQLEAFRESLSALDREVHRILGAARGNRYVSFHGAWRRFAERYGLREVGVVEEAAGEEPTPRRLARLVETARAAGVAAILVEPRLPTRVAAVLASEFGGGVARVDPLGDTRDPARSRYRELMRSNARAFARALGGSPP